MLSKAGRVLYYSAKDVFPGVVVKKEKKSTPLLVF